MRVGLIGTGFMGKTHAAAHLASGLVDELHVLALDAAQGEAFRAKVPAATISTSLDEFLALPLDAVDICTPTPTHAPLVRRALAAGKHVLCEKPLSLDPKEAMALAREAKDSGLLFMVAQVIRFWPEYEFLHGAIRGGELGALVSLRMERYSPLPRWGDWFARLGDSGGALYDLHIHDVDFVLHALGEPAAVSALGRKEQGAAYLDIHTLMRAPGGASVSIYGSYDQPASVPFRMAYRALFEEGAIDYDCWRTTSVTVRLAGGTEEKSFAGQPDGYHNECRHFAECVRDGREPKRATAESAAHTIALLQRIERAADGAAAPA
jgi:predicted dehydrogenase